MGGFVCVKGVAAAGCLGGLGWGWDRPDGAGELGSHVPMGAEEGMEASRHLLCPSIKCF